RTCTAWVTARHTTFMQRDKTRVRMVGVEPTLSGFPRRRITRLSHILSRHRTSRTSNDCVLPLHYGGKGSQRLRGESNPHLFLNREACVCFCHWVRLPSIPVRSRTSPSTFAGSRATGTLRG